MAARPKARQWHLTIHSSRRRFAARLNSGVSPQKKWFSAKSFFFAKAKELLCPTLARAPAYLGPDTPPPGGTSLGFKPKPIIQAFGGNSRLQWANNSFKPTPLRGVVVTSSHPSVPASATLPQRRGLIQALAAQWRSHEHESTNVEAFNRAAASR